MTRDADLKRMMRKGRTKAYEQTRSRRDDAINGSANEILHTFSGKIKREISISLVGQTNARAFEYSTNAIGEAQVPVGAQPFSDCLDLSAHNVTHRVAISVKFFAMPRSLTSHSTAVSMPKRIRQVYRATCEI